MASRLSIAILALTLGAVGAGCSTTSSPTAVSSLGTHEYALAVADWTGPGGATFACAGTAFPAVLHGSESDARHVWATRPDGSRIDLAWPPGYAARFDAGFELLDATGRVVGVENTQITGGCPTAEPTVYAVELAMVQPSTSST